MEAGMTYFLEMEAGFTSFPKKEVGLTLISFSSSVEFPEIEAGMTYNFPEIEAGLTYFPEIVAGFIFFHKKEVGYILSRNRGGVITFTRKRRD